MRRAFSSRLAYLFLMAWLAGSVMLLFIATTSLLRDPQMPLAFGLIHARGGLAVLLALLPAVCGLAALVTTLQRRPSAPYLLLVYSLFWLVILVGGFVSSTLHSSLPAIERISMREWIVGGTSFATMLAVFLLLCVWSIRQMTGDSAGAGSSRSGS